MLPGIDVTACISGTAAMTASVARMNGRRSFFIDSIARLPAARRDSHAAGPRKGNRKRASDVRSRRKQGELRVCTSGIV